MPKHVYIWPTGSLLPFDSVNLESNWFLLRSVSFHGIDLKRILKQNS